MDELVATAVGLERLPLSRHHQAPAGSRQAAPKTNALSRLALVAVASVVAAALVVAAVVAWLVVAVARVWVQDVTASSHGHCDSHCHHDNIQPMPWSPTRKTKPV